MEHGPNGVLPFDLMNLIFLQTSLQAAVSICLSCKYWHDKYKHIIEHDTIVFFIASRYIKDRSDKYYSIKNGRDNHYKTTIDRRWGFFDVPDLVNFLQSWKEIIADKYENNRYNSQIYSSVLRTTSPDGSHQYFGCSNSEHAVYPSGMQKIRLATADKLWDLIGGINYVNTKVIEIDDDNEDLTADQKTNLLKICFKNRKEPEVLPKFDHDYAVHMNKEGDFKIHFRGMDFLIRTSPLVYQEVLDIVKYSKHKTDISNKIRDEFEHLTDQVELVLKTNNEVYHIQEYTFKDEEGRTRIVNNGYKTNALKKVLKILENSILHKSLEIDPFLKEYFKLPPANSLSYPLARIQHYCIPMYGFPIISEIRVDLKHSHFASSLQTKVLDVGYEQFEKSLPIDQVMVLSLLVEKNMDYCPLKHSDSHKKHELRIKPMIARRGHYYKVNQSALDAIYAFVKKYCTISK